MGIFTGLFGGGAMKDAAKEQKKLVQQATSASLGYYKPYTEKSTGALQAYLEGIGIKGNPAEAMARFEASPDYMLNYQAMLDAGERGVNNVAYASGKGNSGLRLAELANRAGETTRGLYDNYLRRISGVADMGQQAAGSMAQVKMGSIAPSMEAINSMTQAKLAPLAGFDALADTAATIAGAYFGGMGGMAGGKAAAPTKFSRNAFMPAYGPQLPVYRG